MTHGGGARTTTDRPDGRGDDELRAAASVLDTAIAVWDSKDRLRWANRRFRELVPELSSTVKPGVHFESWLYRAVDSNAAAPAASDRKEWLRRHAAARRGTGAEFEIELAPGRWFRVREACLEGGDVVSCWTDIGDLKHTRQALEASEERYRNLVEMAGDLVIVLDGRQILFVNRRGAALLGASSATALAGTRIESVLAARGGGALDGALPAGGAEIAFRTAAGATLPLHVRGAPFRDGGRELMLLIARDVSAQRGAEQAARGAEHRLAAALESVSDVVALFDSKDRLVLANRASRALEAPVGDRWRPGVTYREYLEAALAAGLYPDAQKAPDAWLEDRLAHHAAPRGGVEIARQDGRWYRLSEHRLDDGGLLSIATDITERRRSEQRIHFLAHHDALTDLPNRSLFLDRLEAAVAQAERDGSRVAVLMLDLDHFKHVNDTLGHAVGDRVLVEVAARLRGCIGPADTVARFGGDEFAVVQPSVASADEAAALAHRAVAALAAPVTVAGQTLLTGAGASAGVTLFPDDSRDIDTLLRNADLALYRAKALPRRRVAFYVEELGRRAEERLGVAEGLRHALAEDRLVLHYQPTVRLSDGCVIGGEALVRWQHPERGLLSPAGFIGHAEATGLIVPIGERVLEKACLQLGEWARGNAPSVPLWVNVSAAQFHDQALLEKVRSSLIGAGLEPRLLGLEITESALMPEALSAAATLHRLTELGIGLAIDDFGTGYSSLNYLKHLPVGKLKIDRSFVRDVTNNPLDSAIIQAIVHLGHSLGMHVLAEGVETEAQSALLADLGCDEIQGRLIGPPLPADEFARFVAARSGRREPRL